MAVHPFGKIQGHGMPRHGARIAQAAIAMEWSGRTLRQGEPVQAGCAAIWCVKCKQATEYRFTVCKPET